MGYGFDSSTVLYTLGVLFGVFSVIYFGVEVIVNISPTVKSALLLLASGLFFSGTGLSDSKLKDIPLYFLASATYLVFAAYTLIRFELGSSVTFLLLAGSSAVFLGGGYLVSEGKAKIEKRYARYVVLGLAGAMVVLFLFDLSGAQPEYRLDLEDQVNITEGRQTALGQITVTNSFLLSRTYDLPDYDACMMDRESSLYVSVDGRSSGLIAGGEDLKMNLTLQRYPRLENTTSSGSYTVVRTERCPGVTGENRIAVFERERNFD